MSYTISHFINGKTQLQPNNPLHPITNPATGATIGQVAFAGADELTMAIDSAKQAFPEWANTPPVKRSRILFAFKELLHNHIDELATLVTQEHGKILDDARASVGRAIECIEHNCAITSQMTGSFSANVATDVDCYTLRQPLGICAGISPFNFPVMVPVWMCIPAIACGNCFILKPSEQDPAAPFRLAELLREAGLPDGVLNVLNGGKDLVNQILVHPDIKAVTAVASTPVAKHIYSTAVTNSKRSHTFGGAKNHCLVMPDADPEQAANAIVGAAYGAAGERCMAISVAVAVGDDTADSLIKVMTPMINTLKIGPGLEENIEIGPLISESHLQRVKDYVDVGENEGATIVIDGRKQSFPKYPGGYFMGPTLFDHVTPDMRIYQEEIFGPVLVVVRVPDFAAGINLINEHQYGNGTAIFTHDGDAARSFASAIQVGMVGINVPIPVPVAYHPFGGWKNSVFGDTGMHGNQSLQFYTKLKSVTASWPKTTGLTREYSMPTTK